MKNPKADIWEPTRTKLRMLHPDDNAAKFPIKICLATRPKPRSDKEDATVSPFTKLSFPAPPHVPSIVRQLVAMLSPEPTRTKCRNERLLPIVQRSHIETLLPVTRAKARSEREEPSASVSNADKPPTRAKQRTDNDELMAT